MALTDLFIRKLKHSGKYSGLKGALIAVPRTNSAAITEPKELAVLLRAIHAYNGYIMPVSALKLTPLVFVRPGELCAAEWREFDLDSARLSAPNAAKRKLVF